MFRAAVITVSDSSFDGRRKDVSGDVICEILKGNGEYSVTEKRIVPDERDIISQTLKGCAEYADIIFTTGGTGFSVRDITPEATRDVIEREAPGISEAIRAYSLTVTDRAVLSRGVSGIYRDTLIINLPGSPKAVREGLTFILPSLAHGLAILIGEAGNCGSTK